MIFKSICYKLVSYIVSTEFLDPLIMNVEGVCMANKLISPKKSASIFPDDNGAVLQTSLEINLKCFQNYCYRIFGIF